MHSIAQGSDHERRGRRIARGRLGPALGAAGVGCALLATIAVAAGSHDRKGSYDCKATAFRVETDESIVANSPFGPCKRDSAFATDHDEKAGPLTMAGNVVKATTSQRPSDLQPDGSSDTAPTAFDGTTARTSMTDAKLMFEGYEVRATEIESVAYVRCHCLYPSRAFHPKLFSRSSVGSLTFIDPRVGERVLATATTATRTIHTDAFDIHLNREVRTDDDVRRRAIEIDPHAPGVPNVVIGEARAGTDGNPCEFGSP